MATQPIAGRLSFAEYLAQERRSPEKHEYRGGEVFLRSGGTPARAGLSVRMAILLDSALGTQCQVFSSDLRIYAASVNEAMYPDFSAVCGALKFFDGRNDVVLNPTVIVEVLSPSTREYDLSTKASFYRTIPALDTILFVDSESVYVQAQRRSGTVWLIDDFRDLDQPIQIWQESSFSVRDVYAGILVSR